MADLITLAQLKTRALARADMTNSSFVEGPELLEYINESYSALYDLLVSRFEHYYTLKLEDASTTVASGANSFSLPSDFYKMEGLDFKLGNDEYQDISKFNFKNRNRRLINTISSTRYVHNRQYRIIKDSVELQPDESANGTYRLWYTPRLTRLVADVDTIDAVNGWEEYIVVDVAIKMLQKEESDTAGLQITKRELEDRIEAMANQRDSEPETITDAQQTNSDFPLWEW